MGTQRAKILVVEDDLHLLDGLRDVLQLDGYDVLTAQQGDQALTLLRSQAVPPDLIISDIMMPVMDGIEFFKQVRSEQRWLTIPFIFLTAKGEKTDYHRGMRLGVDDYVIKPYEPPDLLIKIESCLERYRKLNQAYTNSMMALKRQILTILNHEFRTPLTFVVAYADMLTNQDADKLSKSEMMAYLKGVSSGAERLRSLVENFMLLVELETGEAKETFEWRQCPIDNMNLLFQAAIDRVKEIQEGRNPCTIRLDGGVPILTGDPEYLTVAIAHLLSNAVKFSEPGTPIEVGAQADNGYLRIWVTDQGRGIPEEEQDHIWESFYQINRAIHEDQGAGAGLAIVHGITKLHGGEATVASELGKGSTFTLRLPLRQPVALSAT